MAAAVGLGLIFGLIALVVYLSKTNTRITIERDTAENEADILEKQRDSSIDNVDDAISMLTGKKRK